MRVLILNQTFHPDTAATAQLMWDVARHLASHGHHVAAVASRAFYGTDRRHATAFEVIDGIEIHRVGGTALGKGSSLTRMADFASFYAAASIKLAQLPAPDVLLALTSPPQIATLAMVQRQFRRTAGDRPICFVYHLMDLYPDAIVASGMMRANAPVIRGLAAITRRTLAAADATIALGRDMRELLINQYGGDPQRIHVIPPWADGAALHPLQREANSMAREQGMAGTFNVVYSGNLGIAHDLDTIVQAIELTRDDAGLRWVFVGGGKRSEALRERAAAAHWPHVRMLPFAPREQLNESLNLADVHLVSQLPAFTGVVVPSKLFGILAVGKPTIMVGPADAECSRILQESSAGVIVPNGDAAGLAAAICRYRDNATLREQAAVNARNVFEERYDRAIACQQIEEVLLAAVNPTMLGRSAPSS